MVIWLEFGLLGWWMYVVVGVYDVGGGVGFGKDFDVGVGWNVVDVVEWVGVGVDVEGI